MLAVFTMAVRISVDSDTWWHLRAGATIVEQRQILSRDPFSLTRQGETWEYPGWLAEVVFYGAFSVFGYAGLNIITGLAVLLAFLLLWFLLEGRLLLRSAVLLFAAIVSAVYWSARPQIFSFTLTAAFLLILDREGHSPTRSLWLLPPMMALWVNLHGGFAIGFILILLYLAGDLVSAAIEWLMKHSPPHELWLQYRPHVGRLIIVGLLSIVFVGLNPHGYSMLLYPFKTVSIQVLQRYIQEWQTPDFHQTQVKPFLLMMMFVLLAISTTKQRIKPVQLILLVTFNTMALLAARNVAIYALVAAPVLARHADSAISRIPWPSIGGGELPENRARLINLALFGILLLPAMLKLAIPLSRQENEQAIEKLFPAAAVEYLRTSEVPGPIFNTYNWGAYVIWALYPQYMSFVDGRTDLFNDEVLETYLLAWRGERGWDAVLDQWDIMTVIIEPDAPLGIRLESSANWSQVYSDAQAVIFTRNPVR